MVHLFEKLEECHLKVCLEKGHFFTERIKYCEPVLHRGTCSPAPSKVDAVRNWAKPKTRTWNLEQQHTEAEWKPCAFFSRKLEGEDGKGQRAPPLVSCLLKVKSRTLGRKVTVYTDHKSLESWYKEDLCILSGPLGRRGRWHEFLIRHHIGVVYKPGKDNTAADGFSRWAYPAGLADDTNFHSSDADQKGGREAGR